MLATGLTVEGLAKRHGYTKCTFYRAINGTTGSKKIRSIIKSACAHITEIDWPEPAKEKK